MFKGAGVSLNLTVISHFGDISHENEIIWSH